MSAPQRLFLAGGAAVLGTLAYLDFASHAGDPEKGRPEPIVVETRERPARERSGRMHRRGRRRDDRAKGAAPRRAGSEPATPSPSGPPAVGFAPPPATAAPRPQRAPQGPRAPAARPAPVAPEIEDEDDVDEDDAADDVGADD